jgi:DNA primase
MEVCLDDPQKWNCWVCHAKGRGLYWLFKRMNVTSDILDKVRDNDRYIGHKRNLSEFDSIILLLNTGEVEKQKIEILNLMPDFKSLAENDGSFEYKHAINYAKKRKLSLCDIVKYNIGYCSKGPFRDRLVFPSYDKDNNLNFYSCRSYYDDGYKYKNSEFSKNIIGFENMVDFDYPIYLCEGALDAISLKRNAIPLFGKTMSRKLKQAIVESNCPEVNIVLDDDALQDSLKIAEYIHSIGRIVKIVKLKGKDPNVLGFEKTLEEIKKTEMLDFRTRIELRLT